MEIIVVGATGYVGSEVLRLCLEDPHISKIHVLTRRPLLDSSLAPVSASDKLSVILRHDWLRYDRGDEDADLLSALKNARACIWCIGGRHTQTSRWPTMEEYLRVTVDYTVAAARAFAQNFAAAQQARRREGTEVEGSKFRFVFCSGHASELTYCKNLWIMGPTRRAKGCAENLLFDIARRSGGSFESITVRPCGIHPRNPTWASRFLTGFVLPHTLRVEELAIAMIELAKSGPAAGGEEGKVIVEAQDAEDLGRKLLRARPQSPPS
ncbi:uncharacterized protein K489DRAFT_413288 [Dissoconium aciculare CBS 342.82]|uniref:NAD(P)-binding protein n=1 Tax=Dissoconium aciculare CBS 342.82 TaxID=1314786 RepID=A0A6J3LSS4_9PEZI|nr:uncharacterized protein K489DRAFT_413288 [Dissoconium aciculare CBS 342.82]KAF1818826.1 hypothetical protein K489DRAFT_413288 [Dissoconium aciculare CBS 342.82]